jgi:hypothetical protein
MEEIIDKKENTVCIALSRGLQSEPSAQGGVPLSNVSVYFRKWDLMCERHLNHNRSCFGSHLTALLALKGKQYVVEAMLCP